MRSVLSLILMTLLDMTFAVHLARSRPVVHETRAIEPIHWVKTGRLDSNKVLPMRFGLAQQNLHRLEEMLISVSHPESPNYTQHFTPMEVTDAFAPTQETISAVTNWLVDSGFSRDRLRLSASKGWIHVNATTSEVENLLNTEYHVYTHPSGESQIGCHNYSVPSHVRHHVDLIKPTVQFNHKPAFNSGLKHTRDVARQFSGSDTSHRKRTEFESLISYQPLNCSRPDIILPCLKDFYMIDYTPQSMDNNSFAIVELQNNAFVPSDLDMFFSAYTPELVGVRPQTVLIDQGAVAETNTSNQFPGETTVESSSDLQYAMALTNKSVTLLQAGNVANGGNPFNIWLDAVDASYCDEDDSLPDSNGFGCSIPQINLPNVVSISYSQDEAALSTADATRQCQEYAKLGMMGTTILYVSGDNGVAGVANTCIESSLSDIALFTPQFPASCPYVTTVGATQFAQGSFGNELEVAWTNSSGGFSNVFPLPKYQQAAVQNYLTTYLNPSSFQPGQYNDSGNARGYPDISLVGGTPYRVAINGSFDGVVGTSLSTPVVASMISMINDARITQGKNPVGFINPSLYSAAFAYVINDVTSGNNPGCGTNGFNASVGWDPITGMGTLNFANLMAFFSSLA